MWRVVFGLSCAACGRVGFEVRGDNVDASSDAAVDAAIARVCGRDGAPPPTIAIAGETFRYTNFDNSFTPVDGVTVRVPLPDGEERTATSDMTGRWQLQSPTFNEPFAPVIRFEQAGYFTTIVAIDEGGAFVDDAIAPAAIDVWQAPHGPIWTPAQMAMVYTAADNLAIDNTRSTVNVAVRDCANTPVAGAMIEIVPPPEVLFYQGADGRFDLMATSTIGPFAHAIAFNQPAGLATIRATKAGQTFLERTVQVPGGDFVVLAVVRQID